MTGDFTQKSCQVIEYFMECVPRQMINIRDRHGASALFYAVTFGHYEVARKLLTFGSLPNLQVFREMAKGSEFRTTTYERLPIAERLKVR